MFARRVGGHRTVSIVRDVVEVAAIIAAGAWAVYTFVYAEHVKPASEAPAVTMTGSLHRMGERNGLIQYSFNAVVRNIGLSRVYIIADSLTVEGATYTTQGTPYTVTSGPETVYERSGRILRTIPIFRDTELSRYANAKYRLGYIIDPGEEQPFSAIFLVRQGDADSITLYGAVAFAKYARLHPTRIAYSPYGAAYFSSLDNESDFYMFENALAHATLWQH